MLGDFAPGTIVDCKFTTRKFSTGAPFTLAGTPAISVYKDNATTESTSGVTLTVDFDARTGLNHVRIDTSADASFYSPGSSFVVVITAGTVDGVSVVGEVVGHFTLDKTLSMPAVGRGTVGNGATTTSIPTAALSPAAAATDQFTDRALIFTRTTATAALRGRQTRISANTAGGTLTVDALPTAPASGDVFVIV